MMKNLNALKISLPLIVGLASASAAQEAEESSSVQNSVEFLRGQISVCEVTADGVEQITLSNGDVIANADWFHDSFTIAVEDLAGELAIFNPNTGQEIKVTDLCTRTDLETPEYPNTDIDIDFSNYDYMCVSSGLIVEPFEVSSGNIEPNVGPIRSSFHRVNGDETILGSCEFDVGDAHVVAPIISYDFYNTMP